MQILNISVMNRPAKTITSKVYPIDMYVNVGSSFGFDSLTVSEAIPIQDTVSTSWSMQDIHIVKEVMYRKYDKVEDELETAFSLQDMTIVKNVRYSSTYVDNLSTSFGNLQIVARDALLTYSVEPHAISSGFGDLIMEIVNEP